MAGFDEFQRVLLDYTNKELDKLWAERGEELREVSVNHIFGRPGPTSLPPSPFDPRDEALRIVFFGFGEIASSLEALDDIGVYVRRFPYSNSTVTRGRHLRYHVENHLNEIYILRERMRAFLNRLDRLFRSDSRANDFHVVIDGLRKVMKRAFNPIVATRGLHTHEHRFKTPELDRVATWELLARGDPAIYSAEARRVYREVRATWAARIADNNKALRTLVNEFFSALQPFLFSKEGTMIVPLPSRPLR